MDKIEFIIPTWERPEQLKLILQSLMVQTNPNWKAHVIIDGLTNDYREVKDMYQNEPRVRFSHVDGPNNDWGHTARNYGLETAEEWVVMTGDDNYYVPTFVHNFLSEAETGMCDMIYCNLVHDLKRDDYQPIPSRIEKGWIDIGNFMVRKSIYREMRLDPTSYEADYEFAYKYSKRIINGINKIDKVLYIHN